jgi:hypothetical protein
MAYKTLTQMTKNMLEPVRGWWDERQLSRVCPIFNSDTTTTTALDAVVAGAVGYLNANNEFVLGGGGATGKNKMPLFARGGGADFDAVRYEGNMAGQRATATQGIAAQVGSSTSVFREVGISCLVGTGAYELGTTEYSGNVAAGDLLMASTTTAGKIAVFAGSGGSGAANSLYTASSSASAPVNTNQVIGIATSASGVKNQYGVAMLYFYVNWWPAI